MSMTESRDPRIVIITGANSGIGKAASVAFAAAGDHVIMACRNLESGARSRDEVVAQSSRTQVDLLELDVSSMASVRRFVQSVHDRYPRVDVLIHNAGYFNHGIRTYQKSPDGLELTFATNTFGPLLLTELLLDRLALSRDARVLNAGSTNIKNFFDPKRSIEFDNLHGEHADSRSYSVYRMYGDSKMGLLLLTYRMARAYAERGVKVNYVLIPTVRVEKAVLKKFSSWFRLIGPVVQYWNPLALSREEMARVYYRIATSDEFRDVTGTIIDHRERLIPPAPNNRPLTPRETVRQLIKTRHAPPYASDPENVERMWEIGQAVVGKAY